jgi:uncharacterized protein
MNSEKLFFYNGRNQKLAGIFYLPNCKLKAVVIFCHGYRSTKETSKVALLSTPLLKKGIGLFAFDFSGRGESEGKFEDTTITNYIDDLDSCISFISKYSSTIFVIGSSLGGLVSLRQAICDKRIKALALMAPVSIFPWRTEREYSKEGIAVWKKKGYTYTYSERLGKMKINYSFYEDISRFKDYSDYELIKIPCLIVHGNNDASVPISHSIKLSEYIKSSQLKIINNADHTFTLEKHSEILKNKIVSFFMELIK